MENINKLLNGLRKMEVDFNNNVRFLVRVRNLIIWLQNIVKDDPIHVPLVVDSWPNALTRIFEGLNKDINTQELKESIFVPVYC